MITPAIDTLYFNTLTKSLDDTLEVTYSIDLYMNVDDTMRQDNTAFRMWATLNTYLESNWDYYVIKGTVSF